MKKYIVAIIGIVLLGGAAGGGYYLYKKFSIDNNYYYKDRDLTGVVPTTVTFPLAGVTFVVPDIASTTVVLDLVQSSPQHDYPMGRFTSADGVVKGSVYALDDLVTDELNGRRAVPIGVDMGGSGTFFYLAILDVSAEGVTHVASLPIGDRIRIQSVTPDGSQVVVRYLVHDRGQAMTENPRVETSATFDMVAGTVLVAGRVPQQEVVLVKKVFKGEYMWQDTTTSDGLVTPEVSDKFTMRFDGNRVELGTDCNTGSATFETGVGTSTEFTVGTIATTQMFCQSEQEGMYFGMIGNITSYVEDEERGSLMFTLTDGQVMTFVPKETELEFEN